MSNATEMMDPQEKKRVRRVNLLALIIELIIIVVYCIVGFGGLLSAFKDMDFSGMFESVQTAILFLIIATVVVAILFLTVKPLRTEATKKWAIFDLVWAGLSILSLIL